jgi:3-dehydroquinate synthase
VLDFFVRRVQASRGLSVARRVAVLASNGTRSKNRLERDRRTVEPDRENDCLDRSFAVPFVHRLRFTQDVFGGDSAVLSDVLEPSENRPARIQFWVDSNVAAAHPWLESAIHEFSHSRPERFRPVGRLQIVPGGESIKNDVHVLEGMLKEFHAADLDRRCYVVVIGGGAVLDAVGFAAAIAHRGLRLVRLPTTTLGQADSGVGVKNGVNLFDKKNWLGAFAVPWAVINDQRLLSTLGDRDFVCGFSEALKVALLKDADLFESLCRQASRIREREPRVTSPLIRRTAVLHLEHITEGGDPFEMLEARPLDFGHWSAHKLEMISQFRIRHGEAVAIGIAIDTVYASLECGFPAADVRRVLDCLRDLGIELNVPELADAETLFTGLEEFRQHLGGRLTLTLAKRVGRSIDVHEVSRDSMREAIRTVVRFASESPGG